MSLLLSILAVALAGAAAWSLLRVVQLLRDMQAQAARARTLQILALFAPGVTAAVDDPKSLLSWQPMAATARRLFPDDFAALDRAAGTVFPFSADQIEQAHARWTADWLAWEQAHDTTYKLRVAQAEAELVAAPASPLGRARLDAIEREKLEFYQARYGQYVKVAKALQALISRANPQAPVR